MSALKYFHVRLRVDPKMCDFRIEVAKKEPTLSFHPN
jgi:hypothetical protein